MTTRFEDFSRHSNAFRLYYQTLKMLEEVYEARVKKLDDRFAEVKANWELSLERSAALHKRIILQDAEQAKTHESIASLQSGYAALENSVKSQRVSTSNSCYRRLH